MIYAWVSDGEAAPELPREEIQEIKRKQRELEERVEFVEVQLQAISTELRDADP